RTRADTHSRVKNGTITIGKGIISDGSGRNRAGIGRRNRAGIGRLEWLEWLTIGKRRLEWLIKEKGRLDAKKTDLEYHESDQPVIASRQPFAQSTKPVLAPPQLASCTTLSLAALAYTAA
ncbi:hypothetical protein Tco_0197673, partial [Tanacetum coccineum]